MFSWTYLFQEKEGSEFNVDKCKLSPHPLGFAFNTSLLNVGTPGPMPGSWDTMMNKSDAVLVLWTLYSSGGDSENKWGKTPNSKLSQNKKSRQIKQLYFVPGSTKEMNKELERKQWRGSYFAALCWVLWLAGWCRSQNNVARYAIPVMKVQPEWGKCPLGPSVGVMTEELCMCKLHMINLLQHSSFLKPLDLCLYLMPGKLWPPGLIKSMLSWSPRVSQPTNLTVRAPPNSLVSHIKELAHSGVTLFSLI